MNIKLENVSFSYNQNKNSQIVLKEINLEIRNGEFVGIVGPMGSGKTTLIELISGFLNPFFGQVLFDGIDIYSNKKTISDLRKKISIVFQFPERQLFEDSVFDDISFGPKNHGISGEKLEKLVRESLECVGLDFERLNRKSPFNLSYGEQRRVAIAGIIASDPEIILLDEPTIAVDYNGLINIEKIMNSMHLKGKTIILVSHDMDLIAKNVNRIIAIEEGKIVFDGDKNNFFRNVNLVQNLNLELPETIKFITKYNLKELDNLYDITVIKNKLSKINFSFKDDFHKNCL